MSKSRLFVFQLKEIIYTLIFIILTIILAIVLINMFGNKSTTNTKSELKNDYEISYNPGVYSTQVKLNNSDINVEVAVNSNSIKSISLTNLSDTVETMYPLLEPSIEHIETQLVEGKDIKEVKLNDSSQYTQKMILNAISASLDKAKTVTN